MVSLLLLLVTIPKRSFTSCCWIVRNADRLARMTLKSLLGGKCTSKFPFFHYVVVRFGQHHIALDFSFYFFFFLVDAVTGQDDQRGTRLILDRAIITTLETARHRPLQCRPLDPFIVCLRPISTAVVVVAAAAGATFPAMPVAAVGRLLREMSAAKLRRPTMEELLA